jgi:hypothetical protein
MVAVAVAWVPDDTKFVAAIVNVGAAEHLIKALGVKETNWPLTTGIPGRGAKSPAPQITPFVMPPIAVPVYVAPLQRPAPLLRETQVAPV